MFYNDLGIKIKNNGQSNAIYPWHHAKIDYIKKWPSETTLRNVLFKLYDSAGKTTWCYNKCFTKYRNTVLTMYVYIYFNYFSKVYLKLKLILPITIKINLFSIHMTMTIY